ncbi:Fe-S protein assembly co-chaperone HscB [Endozoicomonas sp. 4G]|uniref:Fe-S protein assembly co-chaperone HscB n=1 Tax=Endozoicomonas sp. 4G TaxID=2872754 RepID=UPI002078F1BB|nr:Fe-S protein assembly co-chaperone HscB [Endozoicomonas sp. 4G]
MSGIVVDLTKNFFELFQLPVEFQVDQALLSERYRELQKLVHPDRFAGEGESQQRLAVQYAAFVNEGLETLKSPLDRALYLLELAGHPVDLENNTVMDTVFLMEQMELREAISDIREHQDPESELDRLIAQVDQSVMDYQNEFASLWQKGDKASLEQAAAVVQKMQFMVKLSGELEQLEAGLLDD